MTTVGDPQKARVVLRITLGDGEVIVYDVGDMPVDNLRASAYI